MESVTGADKALNQSIVLVGLMGAGKSKIGRTVAANLDLPFVDSDDAVETTAGMDIASIFELYGEERFRALEISTIESLLNSSPKIIATGGGAFMQDKTRALIKSKGLSVWLKAEPETLASRISNPASRPLLKDRDPEAVLRDLAAIRYPVYGEADLVVDTDGLSITAAVNKVETVLRDFFDAQGRAENKG